MTPLPDPPGIRRKWRPSLAMVIGFVLAVVLVLPLAGMAAVVVLTRSPDVLFESLGNNLVHIVAAGAVVAAATALVGFLFWRLVSRPVRELLVWTGQVARPGPAPATGAMSYGTRELARLAESFNEMVRRLDERSAYIATYTAHVSHELKSPLSAIAGAAEIMREAGEEMDADDRARFLSNIEQDARRLSELVARMRELARAEADRPAGGTSLTDLLPRLEMRYPQLSIETAGADGLLPLPADDAFLVLSHLADNAVAHGARKMTVELADDPGGVRLLVSNDGVPISPGNAERIFEPFFTTRREAGGTGMGLAIVRALLKSCGATIELVRPEEQSAGDGGVRFRIGFPRAGQ